jgi:hypothetical protein
VIPTSMAEQLSPAAHAAIYAWWHASDGEYINGVWTPNRSAQLAAALEALADQSEAVHIVTAAGFSEFDAVLRVSDIHAIAAELKTHA